MLVSLRVNEGSVISGSLIFFVKVNILHLIQYNLEIYIYIYIFKQIKKNFKNKK